MHIKRSAFHEYTETQLFVFLFFSKVLNFDIVLETLSLQINFHDDELFTMSMLHALLKRAGRKVASFLWLNRQYLDASSLCMCMCILGCKMTQ